VLNYYVNPNYLPDSTAHGTYRSSTFSAVAASTRQVYWIRYSTQPSALSPRPPSCKSFSSLCSLSLLRRIFLLLPTPQMARLGRRRQYGPKPFFTLQLMISKDSLDSTDSLLLFCPGRLYESTFAAAGKLSQNLALRSLVSSRLVLSLRGRRLKASWIWLRRITLRLILFKALRLHRNRLKHPSRITFSRMEAVRMSALTLPVPRIAPSYGKPSRGGMSRR
jgi:hypothetical protein